MLAYETSIHENGGPYQFVADAAHAFLASGRSVAPIHPNEKYPKGNAWKAYQKDLPPPHILTTWFDGRSLIGVCIICGHVSGDLECLDFDEHATYETFVNLVNELGYASLLDRLVIEYTPRPGVHLGYRCEVIEGNRKLARKKIGILSNGKDDVKALIETRGEGGLVVVSPTPPGIHPDCPERGYELIQGDWTRPPLITPDEREIIWNCARALNCYEPKAERVYGKPQSDEDRVGSDYNARVTVQELLDLLESEHWKKTYSQGDGHYLRRPGKDRGGWSATLNICGPKRLYVFSKSLKDFEDERSYDPFGIYMRLKHGGDATAAARALAELGYGRNGQPHQGTDATYHTSQIGDAPQDDTSGKPVIQLSTNMTAVVSRMQAIIRRHPSGPFLYQRAHQLSVITRGATPPKWLDRAPDAPLIHPADKAFIREIASYAADWVKYDGRKKAEVKTLPPPWAIETLMARPKWSFPPLEGIICAPTLRPDGSVLDQPGYDLDTGLYLYLDQMRFPPIPAHPTLDDAKYCVQLLAEVFDDFPFLRTHHKSAALSAILSLVARFTIKGKVPFFAVRSTTRGAGKGLLIDAIAVIATGRHAPRWAQTLDEEEERKRLMTIAMSGDAALHIDNITHPLGSGALDMVMTAEAITERVMATHAERTAPIKAVFFGSGNNMVFQSDMARRIVTIDLAPKEERPDERDDFAHYPLLTWVMEQRPSLVVAALTIVKAYIEADRPKQPNIKPFGSYEEWSNLIRQSLIWAGEPDPCAGRGEIEAESDPKYEMQKIVLRAWHDRYGEAPKTLKEVKDDIDNHTFKEMETDSQGREHWTGKWITDPSYDDLQAALITLDRHAKAVDLTAVRYAFRAWAGRVLAGLQLQKAGEDRLGVVKWCVKKID
jgi:Bifunctional DNA primase/polymerase, N-terminal